MTTVFRRDQINRGERRGRRTRLLENNDRKCGDVNAAFIYHVTSARITLRSERVQGCAEVGGAVPPSLELVDIDGHFDTVS